MSATSRRAGPSVAGLSALALLCTLAVETRAQGPLPRGVPFEPVRRPGDVRPEVPAPEPERPPAFSLPPLPEPGRDSRELSQRPLVRARGFRVVGSSVFSDAQLAAVTEPYVGRELGAEELEQLRQQLTLLYVRSGYLNSGALLPDQDVHDGVIQYRIVEGRLGEVEIEGNRWFRRRYLESRILRGAGQPLDVAALERELQILQQDPRIRRVDAALLPGDRPGDARLRASFEEEPPFRASLSFDNYDSPSVGQYRTQLDLADDNLTGWGDSLHGMAARTRGLWDFDVGYELPITPWDTTLGAWLQYGSSEVIEDPFDPLDIKSRSHTLGFELRQPVYRSVRSELALGVNAENRESKTFLLGEPFPFEEGTEDGKVIVSVLRPRVDFLYRDLAQVFAARAQLSVGVHMFGATNDGCAFDAAGVCSGDATHAVPDAHFLAWLLQLQWVRRFETLPVEAVARADLQVANKPLFSLEQFSLGGHDSVRGYRENQLVRDNGVAGSLELRFSLWRSDALGAEVQLCPFFDLGRSWNTDRPDPDPATLSSTGVGLRASLSRHLHAQVYWAHQQHRIDEPEDGGLQDDGVQFSISASY